MGHNVSLGLGTASVSKEGTEFYHRQISLALRKWIKETLFNIFSSLREK